MDEGAWLDLRRTALRVLVLLLGVLTVTVGISGRSPATVQSTAPVAWARGIEGQRKADLGDGTYLNPILAGDHPDPSILKDGDTYYMTFSSFDAYPGLVIWQSRDLVNWQPVGPSLFKNVGSVWAPDLVKHGSRYYIYFPGVGPYRSNYVIWADSIRGPWSEPIDLKVGQIDPGHAVGPDGRRYLFLSAGQVVPLADDGLSVTEKPRKVYDGWKFPDDWVVEGFAQEGPKILKRGDYYHMVLAEGGTAGPPTGHMIVSARSKSIDGPWENSPHNPIVRTQSGAERWWSKGHGTLVEGPDGGWFMVYHAYENGYLTLGRQTMLEPIEWTDDGWFRTAGSDPAKPIKMPARSAGPHGMAFSDDFTTDRMGIQWSFYKGSTDDRARYRYENGTLVLKAKGARRPTRRRCGSSTATRPTRSKSRSTPIPAPARACCSSTAAGCTRASASRRRTSSCTAMAWTVRRASRPTSASGSTSAFATTITSSPCTTARMARRGGSTTVGWNCRAITTTWRTSS